MTDIEVKIQQIAEKSYLEDCDGGTRLKEYLSTYKKGVRDADAVGFADWIDGNYHKDNDILWFNRYDNEPKGFSTEELYLKYLNRNNETQNL